MVGGEFAAEEYVPGRRYYVVFAVLLITLVVLGLYVASRFEWEEVVGGSAIWLWLAVTVVTSLVVPDLAQYALLRRLGVRPRRIRWIERDRGLLFAWWKAPDHRFTRGQFAVTYGVPVLILCAVVVAYVVRFPTAAPILGLVLPFYLGNLWCALLVLRKPEGTLVQPLDRGLRFHAPAVRAP